MFRFFFNKFGVLFQFLAKKVRFVKFYMTKLVFVPIFSYNAQVCSIFWQQNRGLFQYLATKIDFLPISSWWNWALIIFCEKNAVCSNFCEKFLVCPIFYDKFGVCSNFLQKRSGLLNFLWQNWYLFQFFPTRFVPFFDNKIGVCFNFGNQDWFCSIFYNKFGVCSNFL